MVNQQSRRYIIRNTTVKAPRVVDGRDRRTIQEKMGYNVQFRDEIGAIKSLSPRGNPIIVTNIPHGLLEFHAQGLVRIEEVPDIAATLSQHKGDPIKTITKKEVVEEPAGEQEGIAPVKEEDGHPRAKASEMGVQDYSKEDIAGDHGYPGAVNPDGKDNFTVVAGKKSKKKKHQSAE